MKILYLANARIPNDKAHGIQIAKMCEALIEEGAELTLIVPERGESRVPLKEYYDLRVDVPVVRLPVLDLYAKGRAGYVISSALFMLSYLAYLGMRKISGERFLVYTIDMDSFSSAALRLIKAPYVSEMHVGRPANLFSRFFFGGMDGVIAITTGVRHALSGTFGIPSGRCLIEPNGVDLSLFSSREKAGARRALGLPEDAKIALYAGRLYAWKGLDTLVGAAHLLEQDGVSTIVLGGNAEELENIAGRALPDSLRCIEPRPQDQVPLWLAASDVLLVLGTKRNAESFRYTSPMKAFEYLAAGRPVVASATPALKGIFGDDTALFCEPDSAESLAETVRQALAESGEERIRRGQELVGRHTWNARAARILAWIQEVAVPGDPSSGYTGLMQKISVAIRLLTLGLSLGASFSDKIALSWFLISSRLKHGQGAVTRAFRILACGTTVRVQLRDNFADAFILEEAFLSHDYDDGLPSEDPKVIFDVGANLGFVTMHLKLKYPEARIFCFEPDPDNYAQLVANTAQFEGITCFKSAIGAANGTQTFYRSPLFHMRNSLVPNEEASRIEVDVITLEEAMERSGVESVDLLKFDVEGGEVGIFAPGAPIEQVRSVIGEVHPYLLSKEEYEPMIQRLEGRFDLVYRTEGKKVFLHGSERA